MTYFKFQGYQIITGRMQVTESHISNWVQINLISQGDFVTMKNFKGADSVDQLPVELAL